MTRNSERNRANVDLNHKIKILVFSVKDAIDSCDSIPLKYMQILFIPTKYHMQMFDISAFINY